MMTAALDVSAIPRIRHDEAMAIAGVETGRFAAALRGLQADDWIKPTDCPRWDVRELTAHVVGSAAGQASPREFFRQVRAGRPVVTEIGAEYWWDGMNEVQVRERSAFTGAELINEWERISPRALRARAKFPKPAGKLPLLKLPAPVGRQSLSYLFDVGFTRDLWMHRIDLTTAAGTAFEVDGSHDGRIVADLVAEWATTHNDPFTLELTGPAGGTFTSGPGGECVEIDAIAFTRTLAGRLPGTGLLRHPLPL
jgi:uncharacterized protein (TIGR03083 family)